MRLEHDFPAYDSVHQIIQQRLPSPIGYLYLKQPADVIVKRLGLRGRAPEKSLVEYVVSAMEQLEILVCSLPSTQVLEVTDGTSLDEISVWLQNRGEN
jgi:deoxyadenosine/deoxycytidine kinase